jgi:predicted NAD/FAD-dependent oxidoreductase
MKTDILIIGAGLSGLLLARNTNRSSLILEKSKGLGGRIANRRIEDMGFDPGAPYLASDPAISQLFESTSDVITTDHGVFTKGSMTRLPKELAKDLQIRKSTRAELIEKTSDGWQVKTDTEEIFEASVVVVTAPLPQGLELLQKSAIVYPKELSSITYDKALMALIITKDGLLPDRSLPSSLHSIQSMAERNLHPHGFVVRMSPSNSDEFFDKKDEESLDCLVKNFENSFSVPPMIEYKELKKWRYVTPRQTVPFPFAEPVPGLFLIGDGFVYPDARGSVFSALSLSEKLNLAF